MDVHVISKQDPAHHEVPPSSSPNRRSHLRPPPSGLTYAMLGTAWKWWDTYPVPRTAPAPYNDPAAWGIVPAWGYATVLESTIPNLPAGTSIFGYWPASGHAVDLQMTPRRPHDGHWTEVSPHRRGLFWLYNQYTSVVDKIPAKDPETLGWECAVRTIWTCGYLLSEYVFTPYPAAHPPLHPCPGAQWTAAEDADLSHAVVISLGASTKTGRSFAHNLACRPAGTGPLAFLQVTSAPAAIADATTKLAPPFPTKTMSYSDIAGAAVEEWLASKQASKIVLVNFGRRDGGVEQVLGLIQNNPALKAARLVFIGVGFQQKVYTVEELFGLGTLNTSSIMEAALGVVDPRKFYDEVDERWNYWLVNRKSAAPDLRMVWGKGVVGGQGLEGDWESLCKSQLKPEEALVYRLYDGKQARHI
ncbi:DUF2855 family protein [Aspergillus brunneoviolaceus CBS 621.78]|uniref:Uncharacterized protein n=1 Tax=Aspergillus brunneoviolaceus CBS 621.78 TaxID=1450534 RepID=A0ACD1G7E9_9EURO|nr:hypothetical protein BO95DRAFT_453725 [Aspergillus brunneoviolaceus CBS 621.78]RAH45046.1 hypothetical protein BO95DRAFT_453725 [Aspergillus brunneoviolaceus CBS 621.78]